MGLNKDKCDPILGLEVHKVLMDAGVETPFLLDDMTGMSHEDKIAHLQMHFTGIMRILNLDLSDDSLKDSPRRVAKMYLNEFFWGLNPDNFPKCTVIENKMGYDEMVLEKNISVISQCEHHFVTIAGVAHIAYIPRKKVIGLSKLNRVVEYFARRPQVQERLTEQVYHALSFILDTPDVAVVIEADHFCVKARGIQDPHSKTITSKLGGAFKKEPDLRSEFMNLIKE